MTKSNASQYISFEHNTTLSWMWEHYKRFHEQSVSFADQRRELGEKIVITESNSTIFCDNEVEITQE
jgi:hypothetical protein